MLNIIQSQEETITCPNCDAVQQAESVLFEGAPFWAKTHECTVCGYVIMESEWELASDEQMEIAVLKRMVVDRTAVAQEAWKLPIDHKINQAFAKAVMTAVHNGSFVPKAGV